MRKRLIGVRHPVGVFALLHGSAATVRCVDQLSREPFGHGLLGALARCIDQPADGQRLSAFRPNLNRHLIGGTANAARPNFQMRLHVAERVVEQPDRLTAGPLGHAIERPVDDALGDRALAVIHEAAHELGDNLIPKLGIRKDRTLLSTMPTRHTGFSLLRPLRAVFRTALTTILDALGVKGAANDVIANARKVLHAAASDHDDRVLLQIVTFAGNVADDLKAVGQTHTRDFTKRRVRLLRGRRVDAGANTTLLRTRLKRRNLVPLHRHLAPVVDQLVDRRHPSILLDQKRANLPPAGSSTRGKLAHQTDPRKPQALDFFFVPNCRHCV
ncbi:30S ribosomal protein S7 [alpha proteobacterium BAL199]|nr:30S ribosomal protein S7 [alpha proteobacterium BAL199]